MLSFSPQQSSVISFLYDPRCKGTSLIVEAKAGSGKTTTILEAVFRSGDPSTLICAFNRRIADELIERLAARGQLPRNRVIKAQTLHSIGRAIIGSHERVETDRDATDHLVREVLPSAGFPLRRAVVKTVRFLKETCHPWDAAPALLNLIIDQEFYGEAEPADVAIGAQEVMTASKRIRPTIDFCDMIWRPVALDMAPRGRYKTVVVDEAQDLSLGQFYLIEKLVAPGGRIVLVGDLRQEIYAWRGAEGQAIWKLMRDQYKAQSLPLTWSFRCPRKVVEQARQIVPAIDPRPDAPDGMVDTRFLSDALKEIAIGDFFLSRTNAGAVVNAIRAQLRGATVRVLGGYDELEPLLQLLQKFSLVSADAFRADLDAWKDRELNRDSITDEQANRIEDRYELLHEASGLVDPRRLSAVLRGVFRPSDEPAAVFSTVHKAKGLEAPRVFLLRNTFLRHKPLRDGARRRLSDVPIEEQNIEYVAITRAIERLTWVVADGTVADEDLDPPLGEKIRKTIDDHVHGFGNFDPDNVTKEEIDLMTDLGVDLPLGDEEP